ncbi:hypothetical protein, partial [Escherichia coli]|uniref:hypothetical protein n=1 Tax=Escherichia coli TaxID=562 RepID=UPI003CE474B5
LSPAKRIPSRQMWIGQPARYARELDDAQLAYMQRNVAAYVRNGRDHKASLDAMMLHGAA